MEPVKTIDAAGNNQYIGVGLAKRGEHWATSPVPDTFRAYVAKGRNTPWSTLSPFVLKVPVSAAYVSYDPRVLALDTVPLELWWQSSKVAHYESSEDYVKRAVSIYLKGVACRSYIKSSEIRMSVYPGPDGKPDFCDYLRSRYYYCKAYVYAVWRNPAFGALMDAAAAGKNILLVGPDGYPMDNGGNLEKTMRDAYLDTSVPFGHERVLFCLLACASAHLGSSEYPWEKYAKYIADRPYNPNFPLAPELAPEPATEPEPAER